MRYGSLFAGYDGIGLALDELWPGRVQRSWFVEFDQAPSRILAHHWPDVPNYGDVTTVDWDAVEPVDVLTGGFPCQDLSHAGKRAGLRPGTRSGLWEHMAYAIDQLRPPLVVIENVRGLLSAGADGDLERDCWCVGDDREPTLRALGAVLGDLADLGYDAEWIGLRAADAGAPHGRFRVFIVAHPAANAGRSGGYEAVQHDGRRPAADHWAGVPHQPDRDADGAGPIGGLTPLPTPKASDGPNGGPGMRNGRGEADALPGVVALLPTPKATNNENRPSPGFDNNGEMFYFILRDDRWGNYAPAIARWEAVLGRPAPSPTEPGRDGRPRLSPAFVEWMMGLPAGWVTDPAIGLTRAQALRCLGNGVVPAQARLALGLLGYGPGAAVVGGGALLPTPEASDGSGGRVSAEMGGTRDSGAKRAVTLATAVAHALLPTPALNDMGEGKTPDDWDAWTEKMRAAHGNGNGHGKSPAIEALGLADD